MESLTDVEGDLLEACLAWKPGGEALEMDPRARAFLEQDPDNLTVVRMLQLLLTAGRLAAAGNSCPSARGRGGLPLTTNEDAEKIS